MLHVQDLEHPPQALDLRNFYSPLCIGRQSTCYRFSQVFFSHVSLSFMYATFKSSWLSVCVCLHMCSCVPCPDGQYVDPDTNLCKECPADTVLPSSNSWGKESCKACGDGLKAVNKRLCKSDCHFTDKAGRHYDFTPLDG